MKMEKHVMKTSCQVKTLKIKVSYKLFLLKVLLPLLRSKIKYLLIKDCQMMSDLLQGCQMFELFTLSMLFA